MVENINMIENTLYKRKEEITNIYESLWVKAPDGRHYATQEGLTQAWEEMERKKFFRKKRDDQILLNEKEKKEVPFYDIRRDKLVEAIRQLAGLTPKEIQVFEDFLRSLNSQKIPDFPPLTSSSIAPDKK